MRTLRVGDESKDEDHVVKRTQKWLPAVLATGLAAGVAVVTVGGVAGPVSAQSGEPTDLILSEYVEGSSNNKAVELFNGTDAAIDLTDYSLDVYFNANTSPTSFDLVGSVPAGGTFVFAHSSLALAVGAQQSTGAGLWNGNDSIVLSRDGVVVDSFGQIAFNSNFGSGDTSAVNHTLRRQASVCTGDTDPNDAFDPATEWVGFPQDTFDGLGSHTTDCGEVGPATPVINEFSASTTGVDVEYVEILGPPSTDLSGLTVLEIEGDSNSTLGAVDGEFTVGTTDADGFYLIDLPANALENGTITLLLVDGYSGGATNVADVDGDVIDAVAVNDGGAGDVTYGVPELGPNYDGVSGFAPGGASRIPDGTDTDTAADWVRNDFDLAGIPGFTGTPEPGEALNTPGAPNAAYEPPPGGECGDPVTLISAIQGDGATTPLGGETHSVEAVVTRLAPGLNGFYVQEEPADQDANPLTSEGLFVFLGADPDPSLAVGDEVRVTGTVGEFVSSGGASSQTQLTGGPIVTTCAVGTVPPATPVTFPLDAVSDLEPLEGMVVSLGQSLVISEYFNFDRFGEVVISLPVGTDERPMNPTAVVAPGLPANERADLNDRSRITVDDANSSQNPPLLIHPGNGLPFDNSNAFRGGDTIAGLEGVLDDTFGLYRVQPTTYGTYTTVNPRPAAAPDVGGDVRVASMNMLNYFLTLDNAGPQCGPAGTLDCRGAEDQEELDRQRPKSLAALIGLDADVVGLVEIENTTGVEPAADLVAGLNDALGAGIYDYVDTGTIGTDAIRVGLIYKPAAVTPVGPFAVLDSSVDPRFIDTKNRPALAQTFEAPSGRRFTVAVNHLKSKGSDCDDVGDPDVGDEQGNCNLTRTMAAEALAEWLAGDPTGTGAEDSLIIGDLNAYDKEDPISALLAAGYTDLVARFGGENAYSYVFDGEFGYLDHALASPGLADAVTGAAEWHINADEPDVFDYNTSFRPPEQTALWEPNEFRSSDHDPAMVGLDLTPPTIEVSVTPDVLWPPNHKYRTVAATVAVEDAVDPSPTVRLVSVTSNEPDNGEDDGNTVDDIVIVDDTTFELRAERSGTGSGRIYTITYEAEDAAGNTAVATATVTVPR